MVCFLFLALGTTAGSDLTLICIFLCNGFGEAKKKDDICVHPKNFESKILVQFPPKNFKIIKIQKRIITIVRKFFFTENCFTPFTDNPLWVVSCHHPIWVIAALAIGTGTTLFGIYK